MGSGPHAGTARAWHAPHNPDYAHALRCFRVSLVYAPYVVGGWVRTGRLLRKRLERLRNIQMNDGIKLPRQVRPKVVAYALGLG